ncbi:MAG: ABC transporter permease [Methanomicrobiales archaeon]|nr:ABC transporter permease [Methanomicrobiales archaeon]
MISTGVIFQVAVRSIRLHFLRSVLAALGIVIGVVAIASMGMMGANMTLAITDQLSDMANMLVVGPSTGGGGGGFGGFIGGGGAGDSYITEKQYQNIQKIASKYGIVYTLRSSSEYIEIGKSRGRATIYGLDTEVLPKILALQEGAFSKSITSVVIGPRLADRYGLKIGSRIDIGNPDEGSVTTVRVSGIIEERGMSFDLNTDSAIVGSDRLFTIILGGEGKYNQVNIVLSDISRVDEAKKEITDELNRRDEVISIQDSSRMLETITSSLSTMTGFVMAIAGISLLVAAVSIFNVMMMSVNERIREIGIMRSIGVQRWDIRKMFLYEAGVLGTVGAGIGAAVSFAFGYIFVFGMVGTVNYFFSPQSLLFIPYAMAVGILVCVLSGIYPAWRASNLDPVEALRAE